MYALLTFVSALDQKR